MPDADSRRRHARERPRHPPDATDDPAAAVQDEAAPVAPAADRQVPGAGEDSRAVPRLEPRHPVAAPDVDCARRVDGDKHATVEPGGACGARLGPVAWAMTMTGAGPS